MKRDPEEKRRSVESREAELRRARRAEEARKWRVAIQARYDTAKRSFG